MKFLKLMIVLIITLACSQRKNLAYADGHVSSGGTQPSAFEYERTALVTILNDENVKNELHRAAGDAPSGKGIIAITQHTTKRNNWTIEVEGCALEVKFISKCSGESPTCEFSAELVNKCSDQ